jgi:hypothetical protein
VTVSEGNSHTFTHGMASRYWLPKHVVVSSNAIASRMPVRFWKPLENADGNER